MAGTTTYNPLSEEERKKLAAKTRQDYEREAIERNWATAQPGSKYSNGASGLSTYTGWNGGSVTGADMFAAVSDANRYSYDIMLDPRNNGGARDAIGEVLLEAQKKANEDAINGIGNYDDNLKANYETIGWTGDWQQVFDNLQKTGTLGLKDLKGNDIQSSYNLGNPNYGAQPVMPTEEEMRAAQQQQAYQQYVLENLSPLMGGNAAGMGAGGGKGQNGGTWGYDLESDPVWQAYLSEYSRAAKTGMNDAMAQLAARTGGLASTYAGQVGQQTYDQTMQGATDMIPTLYSDAYGRYTDQRDYEAQQEQMQYERQMAAEQQAYERQMAAAQLQADQRTQNQDLLLSLMSSYGYMPSAEELTAAGLSQEMADSIVNGYNLELQQSASKGKSSGGGLGGTPETEATPVPEETDTGASEWLVDPSWVNKLDYNQRFDELGGLTLGEYEERARMLTGYTIGENGEKQQSLLEDFRQMKEKGMPNEAIRAEIRGYYEDGLISDQDLIWLMAMYA